MTNNNDQERVLFDKWLVKRCLDNVNAGEYEAAATLRGFRDVIYIGWQARAQQPASVAVPALKSWASFADALGLEFGMDDAVWDKAFDLYQQLAAAPHPVSGEQKADTFPGSPAPVPGWDSGFQAGWNECAAAQDVSGLVPVPREALANFIEYSVPGQYGCDEKWFTDKKALVAALAAHRTQVQGGDA